MDTITAANIIEPRHTINMLINALYDKTVIPGLLLAGIAGFTGFGIEEVKEMGGLIGPAMAVITIAGNYYWHWRKKKAEHRILLTKVEREEHMTKLFKEGKMTEDELKKEDINRQAGSAN